MKAGKFAIMIVLAALLGGIGGYAVSQATGKGGEQVASTGVPSGSVNGTSAGASQTTTQPTGTGSSGSGRQGSGTSTSTAGVGAATGAVQKIDGNKITLTARDGSSVTVNVTDATAVEKLVQATIADVATGMNLTVTGATQSDGSVSAMSITAMPAGAAGLGAAQSAGGLGSGRGGQTTAGSASGSGSASGGTAGAGGFARGTAGTVQGVSGNTITLTATGGSTVKVVVGSQTIIEKLGRGTISDVRAGLSITATGSRQSDGSINAASIIIAPGAAAGAPGTGIP